MSTFKCFKKGGEDNEHLYEGMRRVASEFVQHQGSSNESEYVYGITFYNIQANYDVTYEGEEGDDITVTEKTKDNNNNDKYVVKYKGSPIQIVGDRDKNKKNKEKVTMALPAGPVSTSDQYLNKILTILDDKDQDPNRSAFLLGVILLSKCR